MSAVQVAVELDALAERIARIRSSAARNPHGFHEDRSEAAHEARALAEWLRTGRRPGDFELAANRQCR
jgi:hypothetical protein